MIITNPARSPLTLMDFIDKYSHDTQKLNHEMSVHMSSMPSKDNAHKINLDTASSSSSDLFMRYQCLISKVNTALSLNKNIETIYPKGGAA